MSTKQALCTQADVFRLPIPESGEKVYFDEGKAKDCAPGLALRIRAAGSRKFVFFYRLGGRLLKFTIGDVSGWTLDKARATARSRHGAAGVVISVTIKPDLLNRLDAWCASRLPPATRSAAIAAAVERLLADVK